MGWAAGAVQEMVERGEQWREYVEGRPTDLEGGPLAGVQLEYPADPSHPAVRALMLGTG